MFPLKITCFLVISLLLCIYVRLAQAQTKSVLRYDTYYNYEALRYNCVICDRRTFARMRSERVTSLPNTLHYANVCIIIKIPTIYGTIFDRVGKSRCSNVFCLWILTYLKLKKPVSSKRVREKLNVHALLGRANTQFHRYTHTQTQWEHMPAAACVLINIRFHVTACEIRVWASHL